MSPEPHEIGARLTVGRKQLGLSQMALAAILDVDQKTVSRWELGATTPNAVQLIAICNALELDPGAVLGPVAA